MDELGFWELIEAGGRAGSCAAQAQVVADGLREAGLAEVVDFSARMDECLDALYTWELWAVAYLAEGGCSDDGFEYFRCWVIGSGREAFALAASDPIAFGMTIAVDDDDRSCEELLYVAGTVHEELTGAYGPPRAVPHPTSPRGEEWEEDELDTRYPELSARWS